MVSSTCINSVCRVCEHILSITGDVSMPGVISVEALRVLVLADLAKVSTHLHTSPLELRACIVDSYRQSLCGSGLGFQGQGG